MRSACGLGFVILAAFLLNQNDVSYAQTSLYCCTYCRAEQGMWMAPGTRFQLSVDVDETAMLTPPAMMVDDVEEVPFSISGRNYQLSYSGAPLRLLHEDLSDADSIQSDQYLEIDLAEPKPVGGIMTQGGFYEERLQNLFTKSETWVREFALSASNNSRDYYWQTDDRGNVQIFSGNTDMHTSVMNNFDLPVVARYFRFHPLKAQNQDGDVTNVNARISVIVCSPSPCAYPQISCVMSQWSGWSECACSGGCSQSRERGVIRVQSCGGERCGQITEERACVEENLAWQSAMLYVGVALGVVIVGLVIGFIVYKKTHRDRVEVIVVRENDDDDDDDAPPRPGPPPAGGPPGGPGFGGPRFPPGIRPGFGPGMGPRPRFPGPGPSGPVRFSGQAGGVAPVQQ